MCASTEPAILGFPSNSHVIVVDVFIDRWCKGQTNINIQITNKTKHSERFLVSILPGIRPVYKNNNIYFLFTQKNTKEMQLYKCKMRNKNVAYHDRFS